MKGFLTKVSNNNKTNGSSKVETGLPPGADGKFGADAGKVMKGESITPRSDLALLKKEKRWVCVDISMIIERNI
jgi:hypothetical protein